MDLRIRMIFDEDLNRLSVPKVKELLFRVNRDTPFEAAAKALATKNGHPKLWQAYAFSHLRPRTPLSAADDDRAHLRAVEDITDLRKRFGAFTRDEACDGSHELVFFYKINAAFESPF